MQLKLISWNVNGIRAAVKNGFEQFLKDTEPDILGLQEIKIDNEARARETFDFKGYNEYWYPAEQAGYSGTAILSKIEPLSYQEGMGIEEFDTEGRVQTMEFEKFYFVNAYFPNSGRDGRLDFKVRFNQAFLEFVKELEKEKSVVFCGDLNVAHTEIDLARPKENEGNPGYTPEEREGMDTFSASGFVDTFRYLEGNKIQYSWWSYRMHARERNVGWRIDYFLVSDAFKKYIKKAFILDTITGSDHAPVGIEIKL
jgi:exodeoxyribonuclease-3